MKKSEIKAMNRSFGILEERRAKILDDERTLTLKDRVKEIREHSIKNMDELIEKGTKKLQENGVEVIYADKSEDALEVIYSIVGNQTMIAKSKSNTAGEIGLSEFLEGKGVTVVETDLGDRIVQLDPDSRPSHPIGPASHLRIDDIAKIIRNEFNIDLKPDPRNILNIIKEDVLSKLSMCSIGITGANSVAADDGSILTVHNEGNISLVSMLDTHIVIVGIDKFVETIEDAVSVVKLETIFASGKTVPAYMNIISSPSKTADIEQILLDDMYGARRVVVILLDNGRSQAIKEGGECLLCIGCGSCIVSCPIYNAVGYEFGYKRHLGGRGVVLSSFIQGKKTCFDSGLFTCTLCGLCTLECPVGVRTNQLVEKLRNASVDDGIIHDEHEIVKERIKKQGSPFKFS
jgi:L-lactate dehydrogenase complex protein LldG